MANITLDSMIYIEAKQKSEEIQNSIISKWFVQDKEIDQIIENIKSSPEWFLRIKTKAAEKNISVDEQLRREAKWILDQRYYKDLY